MIGGTLLDLWIAALRTVVMAGAPFVVAALAVGLITSLVQAMTQLQDSALTFVPKIAAVGLVIVVAGHWILGQLVRFTVVALQSTESVRSGVQ